MTNSVHICVVASVYNGCHGAVMDPSYDVVFVLIGCRTISPLKSDFII